jgi:solute carrier family 26 (sodium-independent sulfate anion transporter), member 11
MIILSVCILFLRLFKAQGSFLGQAKIHTIYQGKDDDSRSRNYFLPIDRRDGSNPDVPIERPYQGIFIYRFTDGFNFPNANYHLRFLVDVISAETRPTTITLFTKPGVSYRVSSL